MVQLAYHYEAFQLSNEKHIKDSCQYHHRQPQAHPVMRQIRQALSHDVDLPQTQQYAEVQAREFLVLA